MEIIVTKLPDNFLLEGAVATHQLEGGKKVTVHYDKKVIKTNVKALD